MRRRMIVLSMGSIIATSCLPLTSILRFRELTLTVIPDHGEGLNSLIKCSLQACVQFTIGSCQTCQEIGVMPRLLTSISGPHYSHPTIYAQFLF